MKLSVIIVNYNVQYFLEQCLISVRKAADHMLNLNPDFRSEIIVVDNNSVDGSVKMLKEKFSDIKCIFNDSNLGFSAANNQALKICRSDYALLLNPDTVVEEDTLYKTLDFMEKHPDAGALGVKMIDGSGNFLPESKRGFPSPMTSFYKISGLSRLFPKSKTFGKYHLGFLSPEETHKVDILSGAFLMMRKTALDKTGFLDETFFMYGEDIDLSYRIKLAGYENYYFPETKIIHYKGESTKKGSLNYVFIFYKAMIIFAKKHFTKTHASLFSFIINIAIYIRAFLSVGKRFLQKIALPVSDIILIYLGIFLMKEAWEVYGHGAPYPVGLTSYLLPFYSLVWFGGLLFTRNYVRPFNLGNIIKGILLGTVIISFFYAFFEESFRFSRAVILLGTFSSFLAALIARLITNFKDAGKLSFNFARETRIAIVGDKDESGRVLDLLHQSNLKFSFAGRIALDDKNYKKNGYLGHLGQLREIIRFYKVNEIIFCSKNIPSSRIIEQMTTIESKEVLFKIAPPESLFVIGSNNKNTMGDFYAIDIQLSISSVENRFKKRLLDIFSSLFFLLFSPVLFWFQKSKRYFFKHVFQVLFGIKTWVGYIELQTNYQLPKLRKNVIEISRLYGLEDGDEEKKRELNLVYARDYRLISDVKAMLKGISYLGG